MSNDTICVHYIWRRSFLQMLARSGMSIDERDWHDITPYDARHLLTPAKDTLWTLNEKGLRRGFQFVKVNESLIDPKFE